MIVETVPVFSDNYAYLVICEESGEAAAVDPADGEAVARATRARGVILRAIWNTHHHLDHTAGNEALCREHPLRVFGGHADRRHIPGLTDPLEDGDAVQIGRLQARALHTPGHTRGSVCYHLQGCLFTGDTLFGAGCGRLFEGDPPTMFRSLETAIKPLPPETKLYFGHEYTEENLRFAATVERESVAVRRRLEEVRRAAAASEPPAPATLALELETNPFLRAESDAIRQTLARDGLGREATPLEVFTRLRELRDVF